MASAAFDMTTSWMAQSLQNHGLKNNLAIRPPLFSCWNSLYLLSYKIWILEIQCRVSCSLRLVLLEFWDKDVLLEP